MSAFTFIIGFLLGVGLVIGLYEYWQYQGVIKDHRND